MNIEKVRDHDRSHVRDKFWDQVDYQTIEYVGEQVFDQLREEIER